jgi:hypothetical protein
MTTTEQSYAPPAALLDKLKKNSNIAAFFGFVFIALTIAGYWLAGPQQFLRSYLIGVFFWLGMGMGCLGLLMLHMVSGGAWGVMIRRACEAGTRVIWVMWLALLPIILMPEKLYFWADPANNSDKIVQLKHLYLNVTFWRIRWIVYGVIWIGISHLLNKWSKLEDETRSWKYSSLMEKLSGPGIALYFFTMTFAAIDYLMSLDVTWASTIYGFLIVMGQALSGMALVVAVLIVMGKFEPMDHAITKRHLLDLGKLMLALVMLWAYMSFSQYLIIYSGNLPQEITWYIRRLNGGWEWVGTILLVFHFALPFSLLLSQQLKMNRKTISQIAIFIILVRLIDVFWLVEPNFTSVDHPSFTISWLDFAAPIGFGGLWLALFFRELPKLPLLPLGYPDLQKALNHGREH